MAEDVAQPVGDLLADRPPGLGVPRGVEARAISARVPAETRNEAASTSSTCWTGAAVMSSPASSGPATWAAELAWTRPLAATRSSSEGTRLGMAANWAASKAIVSVALAKATAYTRADSASTAASSGMVAITAARARSVAIIRRLRSTRSTHAPMTSPNSR